jgi:hypothetical protein
MFWRKKKKAEKIAPSLPQASARLSLAEGAARFAAIARSAHGHPMDAEGVCKDPDHCSALISPDEMWARQFMTQGIGPAAERNSVAKMPPMTSGFSMQSFTHTKAGQAEAKTVTQRPVQQAAPQKKATGNGAPMGVQIGLMRERPRRSWLGRVFGG